MNPIIPEIVSLHVEESASLVEMRPVVLEAPQVRLKDIQRAFDDRIAAHLDALAVAGEDAWQFCEAALEEPTVGAVFTAAVRTLEEKRLDRLERLFALIAAIPEQRTGLMWAFGWVARDRLQEIGAALLGSRDPVRRAIGIAACSMHRVDPGLASGRWSADADPLVRASALRLVGEIGADGMAPACAAALKDADPDCKFWAAWSSVVIGNRGIALDVLTEAGLTPGPHREAAFRLALQAMSLSDAHRVLKRLAEDPADKRRLIQGSGVSGDPVYVPWLMKRMRDATTARLAGEAFSLITGVDLAAARLDKPTEGPTPDDDPDDLKSSVAGGEFVDPGPDTEPEEDTELEEEVQTAPNDDPDDPNVEMDADDGLPWPDVDKIEEWWGANASRFQPGTRYFMGASVAREHCVNVLKNGYQRQRVLAAHYLCLLDPGTPLFNTSAPAWRQQRFLARL